MRNLNNPEDQAALKILKEGAEAAKAAAQQSHADTDKRIANLTETVRMLQYALGNVFKTLNDFPAMKAQLDQLDYRTLGIIGALDKTHHNAFHDHVEQEAKNAREKAFWELSDEDDKERKLTVVDGPVDENCWVILTTECASEPDQGVFRSKMDVGGQEFAQYRDAFLGKNRGDTVAIKLQGRDHVATILSVRKKPDASTGN